MPRLAALNFEDRQPKVLLLGSGGLSIGQAGEFDYSGTQAIKALEEENIKVVIVNPNIATVQTNPDPKHKVYLYPVTPQWVEKVIEIEKPDAIIAGFGGQTALNCLMELDENGVLEKHNLLNLGTSVDTLRMTEDRHRFARKMESIGVPIPPSQACHTLGEAIEAAEKIGYPVIARAAFALGGLGSGFANNHAELKALVEPALAESPQVLVEKSLKGWKEVEYEVMRDAEGNAITICNMENFDPLGIHTGDSIVVCPSQSLSDDEYQLLRNASLHMVEKLGIIGECNAQFALSPDKKEYFVIEVNARLSRSSALASKASGYPIAYIAAKVVLGYDLLELKNPVTGITYSFFEPALDYITVKIPRWDLAKFRGASRKLGSTMKSVGEVMSIGRTFQESLQKAVRMVTEHAEGLSFVGLDQVQEIKDALSNPTDARLFAVMNAFRVHMSVMEVYELTKIDRWFLYQVRDLIACESEIKSTALSTHVQSDSLDDFVHSAYEKVNEDTWRRWKLNGFGDEQIAGIAMRACHDKNQEFQAADIQSASIRVRSLRKKCGVKPVIKKIDTTAGEYPSPSNYLYLTYAGKFDDPLANDNKSNGAIVLGGGAYRVGTSVEFDWCAVSCSEELRRAGWRSIMINCNPETVSTDYNSSDRLYFEELSLERILDIFEHEKPNGVIASMGGQLPNKLAPALCAVGIPLLGHSEETINLAENRHLFSKLLDSVGIDQPRWTTAESKEDIDKYVEEVGFPVLVRPSFVLSGAAMAVAADRPSLDKYLSLAVEVSSDYPIVLSEFLIGQREIELDGVAKDGKIITSIVSEHIENAGVHSGDATTVVPAQNLYVETVRRVRKAGRLIAEKLGLNGPFNIQFLAKQNHIKVIECNARAARSFPFVSKVLGINLATLSTKVVLDQEIHIRRLNEDELPYVGVKAAMFSFKRLIGADPILGVEMASTGEVGCIGHQFEDAVLLAMEASGVHVPKKGILFSCGRQHQGSKLLQVFDQLSSLNLPMYATPGTAAFFREHKRSLETLARDDKNKSFESVFAALHDGKFDLLINIPKGTQTKDVTFGARLRQKSIRFGCSLLTNIEKAQSFSQAANALPNFAANHELIPLSPYQ